MKRLIESLRVVSKQLFVSRIILMLSLPLLLACSGSYYLASADVGEENPADDMSYLDRFGIWIDVEPYGMVWQPSVSPGWRPFSNGHWTWTDAGWAWVSYEPYGWLVYHYGNWNYRQDIGWFWIEGTEWSPAPVEWLNYDGYCAWAPLPYGGTEWAEPWTATGQDIWTTVQVRDFDRDDIGRYRIARPPQALHEGRNEVSHQPVGIREFEQSSGHTPPVVTLEHGPVPIYIDPQHERRHTEIRDEAIPGEKREPENNRPGETSEGKTFPDAASAESAQHIPLHRMILPQTEEARVARHAPNVQKNVLRPVPRTSQEHDKAEQDRHRK